MRVGGDQWLGQEAQVPWVVCCPSPLWRYVRGSRAFAPLVVGWWPFCILFIIAPTAHAGQLFLVPYSLYSVAQETFVQVQALRGSQVPDYLNFFFFFWFPLLQDGFLKCPFPFVLCLLVLFFKHFLLEHYLKITCGT